MDFPGALDSPDLDYFQLDKNKKKLFPKDKKHL